MAQNIDDYKEFWAKPTDYMLLLSAKGRAEGRLPMIVERTTGGAVLIDDDTIYPEVIRRMRDAGVKESDDWP